MKLMHELEDALVGIILGILIFIYSGLVGIQIPYFALIFPIVIGIFLVLNFLDIIFFAKDFRENVKLSVISFVINIVDITINLTLLSKILSFRIPIITDSLVPLFSGQVLYIVAAYLIIANIIWVIWYYKS